MVVSKISFLFNPTTGQTIPKFEEQQQVFIHGWFNLHSDLAINPMTRASPRGPHVARKMPQTVKRSKSLKQKSIMIHNKFDIQQWKKDQAQSVWVIYPIPSMYRIQNVGEYSLHGWYGYGSMVIILALWGTMKSYHPSPGPGNPHVIQGPTLYHGNLRGPPPLCHGFCQEIAGLIKGLTTIVP